MSLTVCVDMELKPLPCAKQSCCMMCDLTRGVPASEESQVAIFDATNSTEERRNLLVSFHACMACMQI